MNKKQIYYLLSHILSLNVKPDRVKGVIESLPHKKEDWQKLVLLGSKNLVLQALFLSFKNNHILSNLPADLAEYLEYVHRLNFERNTKIIKQANALQAIFSKEGIDCVIMKGTGNIFDGLYHDIGERMVYDMDILVEDGKMLKAAEALIVAGYRTQKKFNPLAYPSTMHYPILVKEDCVAGVEIHRLPVQYHYLKAFRAERVFKTQKPSSLEKGFMVMSDGNKIIHNFIHSQLMHNGHYHADVSLRDLYDLLLLSQRTDVFKVFDEYKFFQNKSKAYVRLMYKVFGLSYPENSGKTFKHTFFLMRHNLTLTMSRKQLSAYHFVINTLIKYAILPIRTLFDKNARNYVFSRLKNKHWYSEHLNAYRRKLSGNRTINE